jgi:hypothetical protein
MGGSGPVHPLHQRYTKGNCGIANLFGADALSRFIDKTLTKEIQSVGASSREKFTQWCFGELTNRYVVRQFCMPLEVVISVARARSITTYRPFLLSRCSKCPESCF